MKTPFLFITFIAFTHSLRAEMDALSNGQAYLAATLAALSTPNVEKAPIQVNAAISKASGMQEDAGAKAIVAIPDESAESMNVANLAPGNLPLCRVWLKGIALKLPPAATANIEQKEVEAEGEKHSVTVWLLGVRKSAEGKPELIVCANQKEPSLVLPLASIAEPQAADPDAPVQVSMKSEGGKTLLILTLRGTHEVKLEIEQ